MAEIKSVDDVKCSRCKAAPQEGCVTPSGDPANEPHMARVNLFWKMKGEA